MYFEYQSEIAEIKKELTVIEKTYKQGLESALWNFNYKLLDIQTSGIINIPKVSYLEILEDGRVIKKKGAKTKMQKSIF